MHSYHVSHRQAHLFSTESKFIQRRCQIKRHDGWKPPFFIPIHPFQFDTERDGVTEARFSTRTVHPVRYYLIDFGHSMVYDSSIPLEATLDSPRWGAGDSTIPEFTKDESCNPFAVDVYCMGNLMRCEVTEGHKHGPGRRGFGFIKPLIDDMTNVDPKQRPTMEEALRRLDEIIVRLSSRKLRGIPCHSSQRVARCQLLSLVYPLVRAGQPRTSRLCSHSKPPCKSQIRPPATSAVE